MNTTTASRAVTLWLAKELVSKGYRVDNYMAKVIKNDKYWPWPLSFSAHSTMANTPGVTIWLGEEDSCVTVRFNGGFNGGTMRYALEDPRAFDIICEGIIHHLTSPNK